MDPDGRVWADIGPGGGVHFSAPEYRPADGNLLSILDELNAAALADSRVWLLRLRIHA